MIYALRHIFIFILCLVVFVAIYRSLTKHKSFWAAMKESGFTALTSEIAIRVVVTAIIIALVYLLYSLFFG